MKDLKEYFVDLGKCDFEKEISNHHESIDRVDFNYLSRFDTGCSEGYSIKVINNILTVFFIFDCKATVYYKDGDSQVITRDYHELHIPIGYKTPKGYFSKKKVDVSFEYQKEEKLTIEQAFELMKFTTDAKENTFDPFWHENKAKRDNAAAWNFIATNFITDPYCTR